MTEGAGEFAVHRRPRLGFLGAGWIGRLRMQAVAAYQAAEIAAIADSSEQALAEAARVAPRAARLANLDQLLACEIDGVVIATPSGLHADQAISALDAGAAVFCQKPLGLNAKETAQVTEAARSADRLLASDFVYRFTRGMQAVRDLIRRGVLGKIYAAELCFHNSYGPDKAWYYNVAMSGGGCVIDLGTHLVDLALWALDFKPVRQIKSRLFCKGRPLNSSGRKQLEDFAFAELELDGGVAVHLACSWRQPLGRDALIQAIYHGDCGAAEFRNLEGSFYDFIAEHYEERDRHLLCTAPDDWGGRALLDWIRRLAVSNRFDTNAEEFLQVARVIDGIYECDLGMQL
jgi:predicted dehydrogenase